jgi:hypothetical protein
VKQTYSVSDMESYERAIDALNSMTWGYIVTIDDEPTRTTEQNSKLWPMLSDIAEQIKMQMLNQQLMKATPEQWKQFLSALHDSERKIAIGENGEMIVLAKSTSRMGKKEFSSLIEFIYMFGANRGVIWSEPIPPEYMEWAR